MESKSTGRTKSNVPPLVVIMGSTATGKTALAVELAERFDGEIIAADSRTVYKGMDISTAKPSREEQRRVPHHLLDITTPDKPITVANFKSLALKAIDDITKRAKLPFLVGGTGLYIDAVIYNFSFRPPADAVLHEQLERLSVPELQQRLRAEGIALPRNAQNPRHLIRALETKGATPTQSPLRPNTLLLGLEMDTFNLRQRIAQRVDRMVAEGLIDEVKKLSHQYGWELPALQTPGFKALRPYIEGATSLEAAKAQFVRNDLQYAKRQRTWFRRNKSIHWLPAAGRVEQSVELITMLLDN